MNEHDSEIMAGLLTENGYEEAESRDKANIVIFNTCSIRENADKRFFGTLGQLKKKKMAEKEAFTVCVCGCMMQQQHIIDTLKEKYPWVDVIYGTHNFHNLPKLLKNLHEEKKKQLEVWQDANEIVEDMPSKRLFKHKGFVNIMYGCNNFCSYCIVPYTRGRERSRNPENIVNEVVNLVADGVKEITLLGQNVNSYKGCGAKGDTNFAQLIYMLNEVEGLERIRFMTSHPKDLSDELIEAFKNCEKLCNYIHLPVQSGSNAILKAMNRKYTREDYLKLVEKIKKAVPGITISTDIIVGFPGETEEDFEDTLDLARRISYDSAFTFLYSIRKGTPAAKAENQVPEDVKHERFNRLVDVINESSAEKNEKYRNTVVKVLVDGQSRGKAGTYEGRTEGFKLVNFTGDEVLEGEIVKVEITDSNTFTLSGRIQEN